MVLAWHWYWHWLGIGTIATGTCPLTFYLIAAGEDYFVGADDRTSVLELARLVTTAMGQPAQPIVHLDARNEVLEAEASHAKLRCAMAPWEPTPTLARARALPPTLPLTLTLA